MPSVVLVPFIKVIISQDKSKDNYRPIALASTLSKVLVRAILTTLEVFVTTSDNQFRIKLKLGTNMCISALKEILDLYRRHKTTIFTCFTDASKVFNHVNHEKLF